MHDEHQIEEDGGYCFMPRQPFMPFSSVSRLHGRYGAV